MIVSLHGLFMDLTLQRFQHRLERFGKIAPEAKKISRALRFGTTHVNSQSSFFQIDECRV